MKQDDIQEHIENLEINERDEEIENNDNDVVMTELEGDQVSWNNTVDAMQTICKYVKQEELGNETEAKLDKLIFDIQKKKVRKSIKQSTC